MLLLTGVDVAGVITAAAVVVVVISRRHDGLPLLDSSCDVTRALLSIDPDFIEGNIAGQTWQALCGLS